MNVSYYTSSRWNSILLHNTTWRVTKYFNIKLQGVDYKQCTCNSYPMWQFSSIVWWKVIVCKDSVLGMPWQAKYIEYITELLMKVRNQIIITHVRIIALRQIYMHLPTFQTKLFQKTRHVLGHKICVKSKKINCIKTFLHE